jgi:hypothetical protein
MSSVRRFHSHPESADGDFYVVNNECIACGAPHVVAPDLIGWAKTDEHHCIWKKQPETPEELEQAFAAFDASEVGCYRYAGTDPVVIARIGHEYCDQVAGSREPIQFPTHLRILDASPIEIQFSLTASQQSRFERFVDRVLGWLSPLGK